ncbi:MAG: hypothetical protein JXA25_14570 [Anaerolineales bacterium]|nr:hypothetical protein [Anaerolineales bacterium]
MYLFSFGKNHPLVSAMQELYNRNMDWRLPIVVGISLKNSTLILRWICLAGLMLIQPGNVNAYAWSGDGLRRYDVYAAAAENSGTGFIDLNSDGVEERILLDGDCVNLVQGLENLWKNPADWEIIGALVSDMNQDSRDELVLLVRRPYEPLPIESYIPNPGPSSTFQDKDGYTYHIVLIGYEKDSFREVWAGSALARPLESILASDLNMDGWDELIGLEQDPTSERDGPQTVSVWRWQGFNFTLLERKRFRFLQLAASIEMPERTMLLISGWEESNENQN